MSARTVLLAALTCCLAACATVNGVEGVPQSARAHDEFGVNSDAARHVSSAQPDGGVEWWNVYVSSKDRDRILVMQPRGVTAARALVPILPLFMDMRRAEASFAGGAQAFAARYRPGCAVEPGSQMRLKAMPAYEYELSCHPVASN